jgi:hypothetical protein
MNKKSYAFQRERRRGVSYPFVRSGVTGVKEWVRSHAILLTSTVYPSILKASTPNAKEKL